MRSELRETIHKCGVPSIIVTHDLRDVTCIGDRACLLERGEVALSGTADDVISWGSIQATSKNDSLSCRAWSREYLRKIESKARQIHRRYLDELDDADAKELAINRRVSELD